MGSIFNIKQLISGKDQIKTEDSPDSLWVADEAADSETEFTDFGTAMTLPLWVKKKSETDQDWWLFPLEPMISIGGANVLSKRNVAKKPINKKRRGTIKERWAEDDFSINISGVFINPSENLAFAEADIRKLYDLVSATEPLDVKCAYFEFLGIDRIVVESYDLPFTKGKENQNYNIKAFSDDEWDLLIKLDGSEDVL